MICHCHQIEHFQKGKEDDKKKVLKREYLHFICFNELGWSTYFKNVKHFWHFFSFLRSGMRLRHAPKTISFSCLVQCLSTQIVSTHFCIIYHIFQPKNYEYSNLKRIYHGKFAKLSRFFGWWTFLFFLDDLSLSTLLCVCSFCVLNPLTSEMTVKSSENCRFSFC